MGSEPELPIQSSPEATALTTPKLLLFSLPHPNLFPPPSDEPPGMVTPPLRAPGSVPFLWEEAPGKPIRTSARTAAPDEPKSLDLPPRLLVCNHDVITNQNHHHHNVVRVSQMTNMPSPTTVLDGPYRVVGRSASYSAVFSREPRRTRSKASYGGSPPRDQHFFHQNHGKYSGGSSSSSRGFFFKGSSKVDLDEGNSVIYDPCERDGGDQESTNNNSNNKVKIRRSRKSNGSLLMSLSSTSSRNKTHLWASLFGSLKQAVPWKSRKAKN